MARPLEYNQSYVDRAREYFELCEDEEVQLVKQSSDKYDMFENKLRVKLPTKGGLAVYLGVARDTLYDWASKYKDFSDIMEELGAIQEERLINNGLSGTYNSTIAKVLLTKHGYREGIENTGKDGKDLVPVNIEMKEKSDKAINQFLDDKGNS